MPTTKTEERAQPAPATVKKTPPYVAYKTFIGFVDSLRKAIPGRIDRSVMHTMSGGTQSHVTHALRTMDLINELGTPTESFRALVMSQGEDRKKRLAAALAVGYPFLFKSGNIDLGTATGKQLLEQFENSGLRGDSIRRSIAFLLGAGKDAGLTLSPYFNKIQSRSGVPKAARNGSGTISGDSSTETAKEKQRPPAPSVEENKNPKKNDASVDEWAERLLSKFPEFDPGWTEDVKLKWFDAFDRLMKGRGM